jgi:hypothetical protein
VVSLWTSGTFTRCPSVRFILPHAGGDVPYIATRVARLHPQLAESLPLLKRQYYDVALSTYRQVLVALTRFAGTSQIVLVPTIRSEPWAPPNGPRGNSKTSIWAPGWLRRSVEGMRSGCFLDSGRPRTGGRGSF